MPEPLCLNNAQVPRSAHKYLAPLRVTTIVQMVAQSHLRITWCPDPRRPKRAGV